VVFDNDGRLLVILKRGLYILPGGGIDETEDETTALARECLEETGYEIQRGRLIGRADQYCFAPAQQQYFNKLGAFYLATLSKNPPEAVREDHEVCWVTPAEFANRPAHESHLWAVRLALAAGRTA